MCSLILSEVVERSLGTKLWVQAQLFMIFFCIALFGTVLLLWLWSKIFNCQRKDLKSACDTGLIVSVVWLMVIYGGSFIYLDDTGKVIYFAILIFYSLSLATVSIVISKRYKSTRLHSFLAAVACHALIPILSVGFAFLTNPYFAHYFRRRIWEYLLYKFF